MSKEVSKKEKRKLTTNITVYLVLRFCVIVCAVAQAMHGQWHNVFLCIVTLILFTFPMIFEKTFKIDLPETLEVIVYIFIFSAEICGEIQNFYGVFKHWDTMLHTLNGFICAAIGFSAIDILNRSDKFYIRMKPIFVALVSFCFSMTVGVLWEFFEFTADTYFAQDMQKDRIVEVFNSKEIGDKSINEKVEVKDITKTIIYHNNGKDKLVIEGGYLDIGIVDTMKDLFVNLIGAVIFSIFGWLYIIDRDKYHWIERFVIKIRELKE